MMERFFKKVKLSADKFRKKKKIVDAWQAP